MVTFYHEQTSFNAGIFDPLLNGFTDAPRRKNAVRNSINTIPMVQGGQIRRGGTVFIQEVKFSDRNTFFVKFKFSEDISYLIEFGDEYMRFYRDRLPVETAPSVPYEIVTPFDHTDFLDSNGLIRFQFSQSADVIYIVHEDYEVHALKRFGETNWQVDPMAFDEHPYLDENFTDTTLDAQGAVTSGNVQVLASSTDGINGGVGFLASDVGRGIRILKTGQQWAWGEITAVNGAQDIQVDIDEDSAGTSTTATKRWRLGLYNSADGYPSVIGLHNDRVVFSGQPAFPDRVAMSSVGGYSPDSFDFSPSDKDGIIADDDAISLRVQDGELNKVEWVSNINSGLLVGSTDAEWLVGASATNNVLAPDNVRADVITKRGSASIPAVSNGFAVVFAQRSRSRLHEIAFSLEQDGFRSPDLGLFFVNSLRKRVKGFEWHQEPDNIFYSRFDDGTMGGLTYMREEGVVAWSKHEIAGGAADDNGIVLDLKSLPSPTLDRDDLYILVERTIDGNTVKYVEWISSYYRDGDAREDLIYADSAFIYDGVLTDTVTGLDHLEGEEVGVLVDGKAHPDQTVTGGQITLSNDVEGEKIIIGLKFPWELVLLDPTESTAEGSQNGRFKSASGLVIDVWSTLDVKYSVDDNGDDSEEIFGYGSLFDTPVPLFTGKTQQLPINSGDELQETNIKLSGDGMFPVCILNATWEMHVEGR